MKAIGVREAADLAAAAQYAGIADRLLLDAKPPKGAAPARAATAPPSTGGSSEPSIRASPYLLSGGLDAGNVGEALAITGAPGVDVSSGVETAPGVKSPDLIRAFIAAARRAVLPARRPETVAS